MNRCDFSGSSQQYLTSSASLLSISQSLSSHDSAKCYELQNSVGNLSVKTPANISKYTQLIRQNIRKRKQELIRSTHQEIAKKMLNICNNVLELQTMVAELGPINEELKQQISALSFESWDQPENSKQKSILEKVTKIVLKEKTIDTRHTSFFEPILKLFRKNTKPKKTTRKNFFKRLWCFG